MSVPEWDLRQSILSSHRGESRWFRRLPLTSTMGMQSREPESFEQFKNSFSYAGLPTVIIEIRSVVR